VMWIMATGVWAAGIKIDVTGRENVPAGASCIYLSNHVSNLDPPVLFPLLPGMSSVLLKKELTKIPLLGTAMRMGKFVPVERGNRREAAREVVAASAEVLHGGLSLLIFPEGTRSKDGRLAAFKRGPFYLAEQSGAPIVPIAISGTREMMHKGSAAIYPGTARVQFLPPIDPAQYATRQALADAVRDALAAALPEAMRPE